MAFVAFSRPLGPLATIAEVLAELELPSTGAAFLVLVVLIVLVVLVVLARAGAVDTIAEVLLVITEVLLLGTLG